MPERPLLPLPSHTTERRASRNPPRENVRAPSRERQIARLGPRFERLRSALGDPAALAELIGDPNSIAPDRAIVFEVASTLTDFYAAAANIPGLEFLAEMEHEGAPDSDFVTEDKKGERRDKSVSERLYFALPDAAALTQLVNLWRRWERDGALPYGFGRWKPIFERLRDIRPWGPEDRISEETREYWREQLAYSPREAIRVELELWYRDDADGRRAALDEVRGQVASVGGVALSEADIGEIRYAAILAELPAAAIESMVDLPAVSLGRVDGLMFIRPQAVAALPGADDETPEAEPEGRFSSLAAAESISEPLAALLDGLPVAGHSVLAGQLLIDDPDGLAEHYGSAMEQRHGTEMASLIVRGDLREDGAPLTRRLYVRPIMHGRGDGASETFPRHQLLVDILYRSVRRMMETDGAESATAPTVRILNLSLGDALRPFAGMMSPWARLVDWLAYRYRLLVLVSAGNILDDLTIAETTYSELEDADPAERESVILNAVNAARAQRGLLAPAEAVNALTIGAAHDDAFDQGGPGGMRLDPYGSTALPNVSSGLGLGYRRAVKPELLFPGGREHLQMRQSQDPVKLRPPQRAHGFGVVAARPDSAGRLDQTYNTFGTSAATALATRAAHLVIDTLLDMEGGSLHEDLPPEDLGLIAKALLVHGASWDGDAASLVKGVVAPDGGYWKHVDDDVARFLGYGRCDVARIIACTENRATIVGSNSIARDRAAIYRLPLPPSLSGVASWRAVTTTLAWFTPVSPRHRFYRDAQLRIEPGSDKRLGAGVNRDREQAPQPTSDTAHRGTVFHERRIGEAAAMLVDDGDIVLKINCSSPTDAMEADERVPFAVAVSVETAVGSQISVYDEVRAAIMPRIRPRA